ncbi:unnamed protein product [Merluccius merluccius]
MRCFYQTSMLISVLPPLLLVDFILGAFSNGLSLWIFIFHLKPWKSSTVLLFNLALADFLLNMILPFRTSYYFSEMNWKFGHAFCNVSLQMVAMNRTGSIVFLTCVALDRYVHVVHPHHPLNSLSKTKAACGAAILWLVTFSMTAHLLFLPQHNTTDCESFVIYTDTKDIGFGLLWHRSVLVFSFYLPLAVIVFCTCSIFSQLRRRQLTQQVRIKKALWFIMMVVVVFVVCFLPNNITMLLIWFHGGQIASGQEKVCEDMENLNTVFYMTLCLTYLNSTLDPLIYYYSIPTFKNMCRRALHLGRASDTGEDTTQRPQSQEQSTHSNNRL